MIISYSLFKLVGRYMSVLLSFILYTLFIFNSLYFIFTKAIKKKKKLALVKVKKKRQFYILLMRI